MTADEVTDALRRNGNRLAASVEGVSLHRSGDAGLFMAGVPFPNMNVVLTIRTSATPADVERMLDMVAATGLPHALSIRPGCTPELVHLARARRMSEDGSLPLMAMHPDVESMRVAAVHPELTIRQLEPDEARVHSAIGAEAFEAPVDAFARLTRPSLLRKPGIRVYVGMLGGEPVTTSMGSRIGDYVGIFNVATLEKHRGRGYGAAVTARAVLDGVQDGASVTYLQSSEMGFKIYERMGFRTLETWSVWVSGSPSRS